MERIAGISAAADVLGVSISTLRRWEAQAGGRTYSERSSPLRSRQAAPEAKKVEVAETKARTRTFEEDLAKDVF
ncbi:MAG TPA: hypothetical protein VLJ17_05820 [Xanthobacteraceae bacterium]|nr:hypothetical protein [Xanthobacteraceae bacterium]